MSLVSLTRIRTDSVDSIKEAISRSLDLLNYSFDKEIRKIVVKPNLCYYWDYSTGQTTDPKFVAALVDLVREKISSNVEITIVESDASAMKCEYAFRVLGFEKLARKYRIGLVNLSQDDTKVERFVAGGQSFNFMVPNTIANADLKINIPKIKYTIEELKITCALKNIYGCNPFQKKYKYHPRLAQAIVALNHAMRFNLCLIDGNIVSGVQPRKLGLVMASEDPVAIDIACAKIAGIKKPETIELFQMASREGLGNLNFVAKGVPLEYFKNFYPRKTVKKKLMGRAYRIATMLGLSKRLGLS